MFSVTLASLSLWHSLWRQRLHLLCLSLSPEPVSDPGTQNCSVKERRSGWLREYIRGPRAMVTFIFSPLCIWVVVCLLLRSSKLGLLLFLFFKKILYPWVNFGFSTGRKFFPDYYSSSLSSTHSRLNLQSSYSVECSKQQLPSLKNTFRVCFKTFIIFLTWVS